MVDPRKENRQLRFGIIGLGRIGSSFVSAIKRQSRLTLAAVAEVRPEVLERFGRDHPATLYADAETLCKDANVEVVYVATPTHLHSEQVLMALDHHKHVLVAKPMAVTIEDAERMIDLARRNGLSLIEAHPQSMEIPILKMREVVESGALGRVRMMHNWTYSAWLYQPRLTEELDTKLGGGVTFRQGAHQFDILRLIGGGVVRSVRAMTGVWDPDRRTEGAHTALLDFEDGTVATAVFSGYDRFHSSELTFGLGQGGTPENNVEYAAARRSRNTGDESELKRLRGYGLANSTPPDHAERGQPFYGLTIVSCERGDIRQSRDGLLVYGDEQKREVPLPMNKSGRDFVLDEVYRSVAEGRSCVHDGAWSLATLELTLAVLQSGRERAEVMLKHQVPLQVSMSEFLTSNQTTEV